MNNQQPSPLIPQGVPLDPKNRGRARVKIAVFFVLAVHGIGLMALLMQGCRREETPPPATEMDTNAAVAPMLEDTNLPPVVDTNVVAAPTTPVPEVQPPVTQPEPGLQPGGTPAAGSEYKVVAGDTYYTIAKKFNVTSKAIADANPNVNPTKLQINQVLIIPPPNVSAPTEPVTAPAPGNGTIYSVKSGDNLTKIATQFGVSVKAIRSANNLQTDRITVGQKLKIPAKGS